MTTPPPFVDALREELVAAAGRRIEARVRRRRHRSWFAGLGVAVAAAAAAIVTVLLPSAGPASADVVVQVSGTTVEVTLVDLEHRPDRIEAAVRSAGIDLTVEAVPVGPSLVGRFLGSGSSGLLPPELRALGDDGRGFAGFALPVGWSGSLRLLVGRPAEAGEPYAVFADALAPGEPLACRALLGRSVGLALPELLATSLDLQFDAVAPAAVTRLTADLAAEPPWADWVITRIDRTGPEALVVQLAGPGTTVRVPHPACGP